MSNTLKLGNGKWATGKDTLLSFSDTNNNYKPLPFSFSRDTSATVVNKDGLIETVGSGEPRIDFKDNTKGALKLEPSRSNNIAYSQDLTNAAWTKTRVDITSENILNPRGVNSSFKITSNNTSESFIQQSPSSVTGSNQTFSFFIKKGNTNFCHITLFDGGSNGFRQWVDLSNFTLGTNTSFGTGFTLNNSNIEKYSNGWYRVSIVTNNSGATVFSRINISDTDGGNGSSVGSYLYADMAQFEPNSSYPTSYIPTSGSAVTRVADSSSQTVPDGVIGQTEGTFYTEFNFDGDISGNRSVATISSGGSADFVASFIFNNLFYARIRANTGSLIDVTKSNLTSGNHKIAIAYASNDLTFYLDGILVGQNTSASVSFSSALSKIIIGGSTSGTNELGGKINQTKLYNTRLSNSELAALTTI